MVGLVAGGRNWLEGRVRNPTQIPGARPSSRRGGRRVAVMDWPQSLHPAQPSLGGSTKGIRKSNDDIYLIEETDKVGWR